MSWMMAGAQLAGTALDFIRGQQQMGMQGQAMAEAARNSRIQQELAFEQQQDQRDQLLRQWKLATAGQKDVYGNQVIFDPTSNSWVTITSPQGQALINRSDAITRANDVRNLTQGQTEQDMAFSRRLAESAAASPLLTQFAREYGAPTKEGVVGAQKIAAATGAGEQADTARGGFTAAALRSNGSIPNLDTTLASLDRGAATGLRTALAQDYSPIYEEMKTGHNANLINAYSPLAARASNVSNIPFTPSSIPGSLGSDLTARASNARTSVIPAYGGGANINAASKSLIDAIGNYKQPSYGAMFGSLATSLADLFGPKKQQPYEGVPWNEDSRNPDAYNSWRF